jgi:aminoglycoside phosphotransferase (APT) family kinase protein
MRSAEPVDRVEVERRIGPTNEPLEVLSGGLKNLNVRVGRDRVLRILAEPARLASEAALLTRRWRSLRTPALLASGADFLLLEYVAHVPLEDDPLHGAAAGRALAEIHALPPAQLSLPRQSPDDGSSIVDYGRWMLAEAAPALGPALAVRIAEFFDARADAMTSAFAAPVLCHCDFKVSNLHWTAAGELLVLDWEFASLAARLIDVGQLLRWDPPEPFVGAFADAYRAAGGVLVDDWRRSAEAIDLCNLVGLYTRFGSDELRRRIVETIDR